MKVLLKNMAKALSTFNAFDLATSAELRKIAEAIDPLRWKTRHGLSPGRGIDNATCRYNFCGHAQMDDTTKNMLKKLAPVFDDCKLAEIAINKYQVGDYLGKHKDRHYYRKNIVIALQASGDGLYIDDTGEFIEDKLGQGVIFEGIGPAHSVPPVKNERYVLIYLYE